MNFSLIIIISFFFSINLFADANTFSIKISLDKKEYLEYEPITLLIEITNESNKLQSYVFDVFTNNFKPEIYFNGEKVKCRNAVSAEMVMSPIILQGKQSYIHYFHLDKVFGCPDSSKEDRRYRLEHMLAGKYSIAVEYYFGKKHIYKEREKHLIVKKTERIKYKAQLEKYKLLMEKMRIITSREIEEEIESIIKIEENSPYSLLAQDQLISYYLASAKNDKALSLKEEVCKKFHESFLSLTYAMSDLRLLNHISKSEEFIGTRIQLLSRKMKRAVEKTRGKKLDTIIREREEINKK